MPPKPRQLRAPRPKQSGNAFQALVDLPDDVSNSTFDGRDGKVDESDGFSAGNTLQRAPSAASEAPPPPPRYSDDYAHHTATATPPLRLQQPAPKPSIFPSDSDSQHSFTYLCEFPESSTLISLIFVAKSEFSCILAYPTTRNATKTSPTQRSTPQTAGNAYKALVDLPRNGSDPFTDGRDGNVDGTDERRAANAPQRASAVETTAAASPPWRR
jgi:hypothetical protein